MNLRLQRPPLAQSLAIAFCVAARRYYAQVYTKNDETTVAHESRNMILKWFSQLFRNVQERKPATKKHIQKVKPSGAEVRHSVSPGCIGGQGLVLDSIDRFVAWVGAAAHFTSIR
jgi:hypothetical protein